MRNLLPVAAFVLAMPAAAQNGVVDQYSPGTQGYLNVDNPTLVWQQQVRAGQDGILEGFQFEVQSTAPSDITIRLRPGNAWTGHPTLWVGSIPTSGSGYQVIDSVFVDCSSANLYLSAGDVFVIELQGGGAGQRIRSGYCLPGGGASYPEPLWLNQASFGACSRLAFASYLLPPPPRLELTGACPGVVELGLSHMTPGGTVVIASSLSAGAGVVSGGACAGAQLSILSPTIEVVSVADANGDFLVPGILPSSACGVLRVQGFDVATCTATNFLTV